MTTVAVSMVKNEADVIEGTLRHMANQVDSLIVADNMSTDGTREIMMRLRGELPLTVIDDYEVAYYQSRKMTDLARMAAQGGATFIVPFDADELWYSTSGRRIRDVFAVLDADHPGGMVVRVPLFNHFTTALDAQAIDDPFRRILWRQRNPGALPKVAFRWAPDAIIHQGNHGVSMNSWYDVAADIAIRHFPYRSEQHFVGKAITGSDAYAHTDLPLDQGAHWRSYRAIYDQRGYEGLAEVYQLHYNPLSPIDVGMIYDPAPYSWSGENDGS